MRQCWMASLIVLLVSASSALAQDLTITNEAGGLACYSENELMDAQGAIGFHNFSKAEDYITRDRCFVMQQHWRARLMDTRFVNGVDATIVKARLFRTANQVDMAWSLEANFASW